MATGKTKQTLIPGPVIIKLEPNFCISHGEQKYPIEIKQFGSKLKLYVADKAVATFTGLSILNKETE
jgi:hypothetical protein